MDNWKALADGNPALYREIDAKGSFLRDGGRELEGGLLDSFGPMLRQVIDSEEGLRQLDRVLEDAVSLCVRTGCNPSLQVLRRFVAAKQAMSGGAVPAVFQDAPSLWELLAGQEELAIRMLSLDDERLQRGLASLAAGGAGHFRTVEDTEALVELMLALYGRERVDPAEVLLSLEGLQALSGVECMADACRLAVALAGQGVRLQGRSEWLEGLQVLDRELPGSLADRTAWLARLYPHLDILAPFLPLLKDDKAAARILESLARLKSQRFGYSDLDLDMRRALPQLAAIAGELVTGAGTLERLLDLLPDLVRGVEWESEETPLGWSHDCDLSTIQGLVQEAGDWDEFTVLAVERGILPGTEDARTSSPARPEPSLGIRVLRTLLLPLFLAIDGLETLYLTLRERFRSGGR